MMNSLKSKLDNFSKWSAYVEYTGEQPLSKDEPSSVNIVILYVKDHYTDLIMKLDDKHLMSMKPAEWQSWCVLAT